MSAKPLVDPSSEAGKVIYDEIARLCAMLGLTPPPLTSAKPPSERRERSGGTVTEADRRRQRIQMGWPLN